MVPPQMHASYTREEILAAFGASTVAQPMPLHPLGQEAA
jgi:hypothetical protein